ncbi:MAG: hypothetical protein ACLFUL_12345 [Desulfobacteraceae bacterium]
MEQIQVREEALPILKSSIALKERLLKAKLKNYRNRLKFFEQKHKMKSKDFIKAFNQGTLGDDAEWFDWVFVYETYIRLKNQEKLVEGISHQGISLVINNE